MGFTQRLLNVHRLAALAKQSQFTMYTDRILTQAKQQSSFFFKTETGQVSD